MSRRRDEDEEEMTRGAQGLAPTTPHHLPHPHHHNTPPHPTPPHQHDATWGCHIPHHHQATNKRATTTSASPAGQRDACAGWYLLPLGQHGCTEGAQVMCTSPCPLHTLLLLGAVLAVHYHSSMLLVLSGCAPCYTRSTCPASSGTVPPATRTARC